MILSLTLFLFSTSSFLIVSNLLQFSILFSLIFLLSTLLSLFIVSTTSLIFSLFSSLTLWFFYFHIQVYSCFFASIFSNDFLALYFCFFTCQKSFIFCSFRLALARYSQSLTWSILNLFLITYICSSVYLSFLSAMKLLRLSSTWLISMVSLTRLISYLQDKQQYNFNAENDLKQVLGDSINNQSNHHEKRFQTHKKFKVLTRNPLFLCFDCLKRNHINEDINHITKKDSNYY